MQIIIDTDALFITNRLKEIYKDYYVIYDTKKQKYELHAREQIGGSYCLTCPFGCLDERFVELALRTQSKNRSKLIAEIDQQNEKQQSQNVKKFMDTIGEKL